MKIKIKILELMLLVILACFAGCTSDKEAKLQAEAGISKTQAETIALARVPNGTVKTGELEKEKGRLIWSFDIATPDSKDITEVNVDAKSGEVIAVTKETPEQEKQKVSRDNRLRLRRGLQLARSHRLAPTRAGQGRGCEFVAIVGT